MSSDNLIVDLTLLGLALLSIATWSIGVLKVRGFRAQAKASQQFLDAYDQNCSWAGRCASADDGRGDYADLMRVGNATCLELSGEEGQGCNEAELREILERALHKKTQSMNRHRERGLAELASIGSTAPFIGLFGTVWGIMNALKTITATGNASIDVVAGPIGEALIATAVGIATAIPAVLAYNYFLRQQRVHVSDLDGFKEDYLRFALRNRAQWGSSCK